MAPAYMSSKRCMTDVNKIHVRRAGAVEASRFVCIHGIGMSGRYFEPLMDILGKRYSVAALDLLGFGLSSSSGRTLTLTEHAERLLEWIGQEGCDRPILLGHSMGAQVALEAVRLAPATFRQLVLIAPTVNPAEKGLLIQACRLAKDGFRERISLFWLMLPEYLCCGPVWYFRSLRHMFAQDVCQKMRTCTVSVLIVAGNRDRIVPLTWAKEAADLIPEAALAELEAGHAVHYSCPQEVAEICHSFVSQE